MMQMEWQTRVVWIYIVCPNLYVQKRLGLLRKAFWGKLRVTGEVSEKMKELFSSDNAYHSLKRIMSNSVDPAQTLQNVESDHTAWTD